MKKNIILTIFIAVVYSEGNLLRCFAEIGKTIKAGVDLGLSISEKDPSGTLSAISDMIGQIQPMMNECSNPMCLGQAKSRCESDTGKKCEQWGAIMYPKCEPGFKPFGCCICVSECPDGFRDDGLYCAKPEPYGRGAGYPWKLGDGFNLNKAKDRCKKENKQGCEQDGAIIYPKCKKNFHNVGCCVCSPNCPSNMTDIGVSCTKQGAKGRGAGYSMHYTDCSNAENESSPVRRKRNPSKKTHKQVKSKIEEMTERLKFYEKNQDEAVKIGQEFSDELADFEAQLNDINE